jgi:hypothetical protein
MSSDSNGKIVDAYVEWDDRGNAFRIYLAREEPELGEDDIYSEPEPEPMEAVHDDLGTETVEGRLYKAAFCRCPKDVGYMLANDRVLGWPKEAPAKRVADAVKKELAKIEAGEPGPTDLAIQVAVIRAKGKAKRGRR